MAAILQRQVGAICLRVWQTRPDEIMQTSSVATAPAAEQSRKDLTLAEIREETSDSVAGAELKWWYLEKVSFWEDGKSEQRKTRQERPARSKLEQPRVVV